MTPLPLLAGIRARCRACYCGPAAPVLPPPATLDLTRASPVPSSWPPPPRRAVVCSRRCACHGPRRSSRSAVYAAAAADAARLALLRERRKEVRRHLASV